MGGLHTKLFSKRETKFKILFQGLYDAGKTTILYRLKLGEVVRTIPTIGFNVETIEYKNVEITAWDLGGRDKMRALHRHYYSDTKAVVYVVDSADHGDLRLEQAKDELHSAINHEAMKDVILLVLANKQDLPDAMSTTRLGEDLELYKLRNISWKIFPTVGNTGDGVYEAFDWLTDQLGHGTQANRHQTPDVADKPATDQDIPGKSGIFYRRIWGKLCSIFLGQV